ncbi:hypothetical protein AAW01_11915 [Aurantiacibacter gangjinensis]|uniref:DUF1499 domain-containing protein n=1 Tax=Aurantiacibacter gangjinensis TaxID=502682 RepID=A0A0G9MP02_9SPHN|nr:hypothetical protein AAW01_11915 [Aurantiacibacter gangjinensis]
MGAFALGGALLAVAIALIMLTLARYGVIGKLTGFQWYVYATYIAGASAVIGLVGLLLAYILKSRGRRRSAGALVVGLAMVGIFYVMVLRPAQSAPFLHDVTTDIDDPPQFSAITLREDNLDQFEGSEEAWKSAHREGYPTLGPVIIDKLPELVIADARAIAEERGWDIVEFDPEAGRLEAVAYAGFIRFKDDVLVEATAIADGSTRVDMRSVSQVGGSDLGYNADRIRSFMAELQTAE